MGYVGNLKNMARDYSLLDCAKKDGSLEELS